MRNIYSGASHEATASGDDAQAKIAHTIPQAVLASGISRSALYQAIARGELPARKCGSRTLILDTDLRRFLRSLPGMTKTAPLPKDY